MNCPNCGTANEPDNRFCIKCGQPLADAASASPSFAGVQPNHLAIFTLRLIIVLLLLWLLRWVVIRLPFTPSPPIPDASWGAGLQITFTEEQAQAASQNMEQSLNRFVAEMSAQGVTADWRRQEGFQNSVTYVVSANGQRPDVLNAMFFNRSLLDLFFSVEEIILSAVYFLAALALLAYAQALWSLWPQTFPRAALLTPALAALVYLIALVTFYFALADPLLVLIRDPSIIQWLQIAFFLMALILLGWAAITFYNYLPVGLATLRLGASPAAYGEVACPHCGRTNPTTMQFCGYCGNALAATNIMAAKVSNA